jgi:hypothetical protein
MRVVVCGRTSYQGEALVHRTLSELYGGNPRITVITTDALGGAALYARRWCAEAQVPVETIICRDRSPKTQGHLLLGSRPDLVLIFTKGATSRWLLHLCKSKQRRIPVLQPAIQEAAE